MSVFPFRMQHDAMQCGIACLQMVCEYHGRKMSAAEVEELCPSTAEGVSLLGMSRAAEALGLHTSRAELEEGWLSSRSDGEDKGIAMLLETTPAFAEAATGKRGGDTGSVRFLMAYVRRYKAAFAHVLAGLAIGSAIQLLLPLLTQAVVDRGIALRDIGFVWLVLAGQLMLTFSATALDFVRRWLLTHVSMRVNLSILSDFFAKLLSLPMPFFDTKHTGDLLQRMADHDRVEQFLTGHVLTVLFSTMTIAVFGCMLLAYDAVLFIVFATFSAVYGLWMAAFLRRRRVLDYERFEREADSHDKTWQMVTAMQEITLQDCRRRRRQEWEQTRLGLFGIRMKALRLQQAEEAGGVLISSVKDIIITVMAAMAVIDGRMTLGQMLAVQYIMGQLAVPVDSLLGFVYSWQDVRLSLERINEIHRARPEGRDGAMAAFASADRTIRVEGLSFRYDRNALRPTLQDVSLDIEQGKTTAIVGASGSGKTTLLKLLLAYYTPEGGQVTVGGRPLADYDPQWWRSRLGVVMQDGVIFSESVARNIAVGDGEIDADRLVAAARMARVDDFVASLPLGYDTRIGRNGMGLSAGQRQRILIARAVYKDPEYVFMDEATNSLDASNERAIVESLGEFLRGRTVLVIAHRLSTVRNADRIAVMDRGRIVECGTHEELTAMRGAYYQLVKNQLEL